VSCIIIEDDAVDALMAINNPKTPTSSINNVISRREILRIPAVAAVVTFTQGARASAVVTTTTATIAENTPNKLPFPSSKKTSGILWRTIHGQAAPATPNTLNELIHNELFGGGSDKTTANSRKTTGLVFVSERHDDFEHHVVQLHVIQSIRKALDQRHPVISNTNKSNTRSSGFGAAGGSEKAATTSSKAFAIGMECFQRKDQFFLDKFVNSKPSAYTINDLKRDVNWDSNWGYDILHYVSILNQAQKYKLRILGLHPSQELVDTVSEFGLAGLPDSVITNVNTKSKAHWEKFKQTTQETLEIKSNDGVGSICDGAIESYIERLYEVQCFREEYMAETAALHMVKQEQKNNPGWVVILAGERHILGRDGIPNRTLRRMASMLTSIASSASSHRKASVTAAAKGKGSKVSHRGIFTFLPKCVSFPVSLAKEAPDHKSADYVWFTQRNLNTAFDASVVNAAPTRIEQNHHHSHNLVAIS